VHAATSLLPPLRRGFTPETARPAARALLVLTGAEAVALAADGRLLAFAVLADGAAGSVGTTETALDVVAAALAGCGCR
jgi:D-alanyl-D-alanine carboxypeptidase/D-alanyl-D-alanine-endopeptidase (penicillin-binding protein 4)